MNSAGGRSSSTEHAGLLAGNPLSVSLPGEPSSYPQQEADGSRTLAIVVVHGMGQHVQFETLANFATTFAQVAQAPPPTQVRLVTIAGERLHRVELRLPTSDGVRDVHLYEAYWSQLTEGRVTLRDIIRFLLIAGWSGVRNGTGSFHRWLFGAYREFTAPVRSLVYLLIGLAVVLSLVAINGAIGIVAAARLVVQDSRSWPGEGLIGDLSTLFNALLAGAGAASAALWLARSARNQRSRPNRHALRTLLGLGSVIVFVLLLSLTIAIGAAIPALFALHRALGPTASPLLRDTLGASFVDAFDRTVELGVVLTVVGMGLIIVVQIGTGLLRTRRRQRKDPDLGPYARLSPVIVSLFGFLALGVGLELGWFLVTGWHLLSSAEGSVALFRVVAWLFLVALSAFVRTILIQYVGDVAVYVQPHILDRFSELRDEIKDTVRRKVAAVFAATRTDGSFEYAKVALVGHSLGSVILYDTLNRLLNDDMLGGTSASRGGGPPVLDVSARTTLLLTFGSPLDKTAFVFGSQRESRPLRAALETTVQPLIADPAFRQFDWINIYSPWDIISGRLEYYDPPANAATGGALGGGFKRVDNVIDPEATTLLLAHLEYWDSSRMYDLLLARI